MRRTAAVALSALLCACSGVRLADPVAPCSAVVRGDEILCGPDRVATVTCEGRTRDGSCRALAVVYASGQRVYLHKAPGFDEWPTHPRPGDKSDHVLGFTSYAIAPDGHAIRFMHRALLGSSWREYDVFSGKTRDAVAPDWTRSDAPSSDSP